MIEIRHEGAGGGYFLPGDLVVIPDTRETMRVTQIRQWREGRLGMARPRVSKQRKRWTQPKWKGSVTVIR